MTEAEQIAFRHRMVDLINEAWGFSRNTQCYRWYVFENEHTVFKGLQAYNRGRRVFFPAVDANISAEQDVSDYFEAERLLRSDTKWFQRLGRLMDKLPTR